MLYCIIEAIFFQNSSSLDPHRYEIFASYQFELLMAKCISSFALHMMLFPHIKRTRQLMKYIMNHPEKFTY